MENDKERIEELAMIIEKYDLTEIEISNGDSRIKVKKSPHPVQIAQGNQGPVFYREQQKNNNDFRRITETKAKLDETISDNKGEKKEKLPEKTENKVEQSGKYVIAPTAGIFYRQSKPGNPPYVEVGQHVKKGEIVCLVEAMKMITEVSANRDGIVKEFLAENEQFVEYEAPLVLIEEE